MFEWEHGIFSAVQMAMEYFLKSLLRQLINVTHQNGDPRHISQQCNNLSDWRNRCRAYPTRLKPTYLAVKNAF